MKAKELKNKWVEIFESTEKVTDANIFLVKQFRKDFSDIIEKRKAKSDQAISGIIRELDQKWNALKVKLHKHYGASPIGENGFSEMIKIMYPEAYEIYSRMKNK